MTPRLTVLMPSWNAALTIERALASVLEEREIPLEIVVIDDGSTDGTADVVQAVADRDPRVVLLRLPANGGVSNARNRGLAIARGTWLAFLDADDRLFPGAVAALMRPTSDPEVRAVVGQRVHDDGERQWVARGYDNPDIREPGRKSLAANPGLMYYAAIHGKVFHRSLIDRLTFEGRVLGDQPWTISALLRAGNRVEVIGETVYEWSRPHPDRYIEGITSATRSSSARAADMASRALEVFRTVAAEVDTRIGDDATRATVKQAYFDRLIRMDIGPAVSDSLLRRDPGTGKLYEAVAAFLASVPASILAGSEILPTAALRPPGKRWWALVPSARAAYWRMIRTACHADPRIARRIAWRRLVVPVYVLTGRFDSPVGRAVASAALSALALEMRIKDRLRRG